MGKTLYPTAETAIRRLKRSAKEQDGIVYIEESVGLKLLGAVDALIKFNKTVVFGKTPPKKEKKNA